ncbi:TPA: hypothetical protein EYP66_07220, partial [Candidatus Poribacteria bacterium]|nr:hypothetical protein [Candidatus Poribacteria bacterium]
MERGKYCLIIFWVISVLASCSLKEKAEEIASYLEGASEEVNYAHAKWGTKVKVYPSSSPGHPKSTVNDGEINTLRGWRDLDNVRWNIANCFINVYPDLVNYRHYKSLWAKYQKLYSPYVQLQFPSPRPLHKVVIYTIDDSKYPAKEYGIRAYQLYYQDRRGNWQLIKEESSNTKGRIECTFPMIRTQGLKLVIVETNDVARLREDETWPLRVEIKKLRRTLGYSPGRGANPIPWNNLWPLLHQLPTPLKYLSKVIEIEAYGPVGKEKPMDIPPVLNPKRYTGKFLSYTKENTDGIENDYVWVMQIDGDNVWFGT